MYDWPLSAPDGDHEITCLIVDLRDGDRRRASLPCVCRKR